MPASAPESPARSAPSGWTARTARPALDCSRAGVLGLLDILGVQVPRPPRPRQGRTARAGGLAGFWHLPEHDILDLLARARANYLAAVKTHHREHETMIRLNIVWRRVSRIFRRRGYELDPPPRRD